MLDSLKNEINIWEKKALDNAYTIGLLESKLDLIYEIAKKNNYEDIVKIIQR